MGVNLLNLPGCINCYHENGLVFWKCVVTNLNGVLLHFILYYLECCVCSNK